jgi:hypothetical protein
VSAFDPAAVSKGLRERIFSLSAKDLADRTRPDGVIAALMEFHSGRTWVSLAAVADGTTSLYFGSGGGIIGAGGNERVREASARFLDAAFAASSRFARTSSHPTPADATVRFYILKPDGAHASGELAERELRTAGHPLLPLYAAGQDLITEIRLSQEQRQA